MSEADDDDEPGWEAFWPPECTDDCRLLVRCVEIIRSNPEFHTRAWDLVSGTSRFPIHSGETLLSELYLKSGDMAKPFIDEAIKQYFSQPMSISAIEHILLDSLPDDRDSLDTKSFELYQGCVWEITAMLACCILFLKHGQPDRELPASCFDPLARANFILESFQTC